MIRLATPADIPSMLNLERSSPTAARWTEQQYRQLFETGGAERLALVAETPFAANDEATKYEAAAPQAGASILGFLITQHIAPEWELENIVVASSARRQGVGNRLLHALLAAARETDSHTVFLEVRESNADARHLYEKAGFEPAGRRKSYYTNPPEDAVLYRLTLV
jgi:ribosomal-protein-alanine acetyltransferase